MTTTAVQVKIPTHLSPSQRSRLQSCPARYLLERAYPGPTQGWAVVGSPVHTAIEQATRDGLTYTETLEVALVEAQMLAGDGVNWSKKIPDADKAYEIVGECIATWWRQVHPSSEERLPEYQELHWPPQVELSIYTDTRPRVKMYLDALFRRKSDGAPVIVDYKTGTGSSEIAQLYEYWWGLRQAGLVTDYDEPRGWFHNLRVSGGKLIPFDWYPGDQLLEIWHNEAEAVKRNGRWEPRPNIYCPYCPVRNMCPTVIGRPGVKLLEELAGLAVFYDEENESRNGEEE